MKLFARLLLTAALTGTCVPHLAADTDGVVYKDKNVRFTVVTDGLIRMEYQPKGKFVDDRSLVAYERSYPETDAKVSDDGKTVTVSTDKMTLTYKKGSGPFTADNLTVTAAPALGQIVWHPGMQQKENLRGTTRTLDRWNGPDYLKKGEDGKWTETPRQLEEGLLARDGWTLIDDSQSYLLDSDPDLPWVKERNKAKGSQDLYLMMYGNDYKGALNDFTVLSGKIPLPPRYAFGNWWSRWWAYSEHEFKELINTFETYGIPLEILVVDMDWHYTDEAHGGWTGWTWNRRLFPQPEKFLNYLRDKNLKITLNLHPASGVKKFEAAYPQIATDMGVNPATEADIPWVSSDKTFINSMFKNILDPMQKEGVNFWWLDWQQALNDSKMKDLSNTWWLNHTFFHKMQRDEPGRPMIYHRWGGLGNHRYQIGFSGDSYATWKTLDYMPYFTSTASNVGYGYWSHDMGGFYMAPGDTVVNPELYQRFFQFGVFSPIMKTHSTKSASLYKEPWRFDRATMENIRKSIRQRYQIIPYLYSMARKAHDTGVSLCRPMYYEYPDVEQAYNTPGQYMFGDNMIVAPVTSPLVDNYAEVTVWLPEGEWYENPTGTLLEGGKTYTRRFTMDEIPVYVKGGSVLPYHAGNVTNLRGNDKPISLRVFPGGNGSFSMYEDYGDDNNYREEYARTEITSERTPDGKLTVRISPRKGSYKEMPAARSFEVCVPASAHPDKVMVDGKETTYTYNPEELSVTVQLPLKDCSEERVVELDFTGNPTIADGIIGDMRRFVDAFGGLKDRYASLEVTEDFGPMSVVYENIEYAPEKTREILDSFRSNLQNIDSVLTAQPMSDSAREWFRKKIGK